ncbi:MAG: PAS domain S-box protein, partial [Candidatus Latescibacterota bacterium]
MPDDRPDKTLNNSQRETDAPSLLAERIRLALTRSPVIVFSQDRDLRYTWISNPYPGYATAEIIGKRDDQLFPPRDAEPLSGIKHRVMETGEGAREEVRITIGAEVRFYDLTVEPLRDTDEEIVGIAGAALDISARKRAEEALSTSEERYRAVSELIFGYVYSYRVEANFKMTLEWLSGNFEGVTGFGASEAEARSGWTMAINPDDRDVIRKKVRALLAGQEDVSVYRIFTKAGETRWVRDFSRPVRDEVRGRVVRIYGATQDITERKEAERELQESEERFRRLAQATVEGIIIIEKGVILDANENYAAMLGYDLGEIIGRPVEAFVAPESRDLVSGHIREKFEQPYESKALRKDGTVIEIEAVGKSIPWHGRKVRVAAIRDITGRKRMEEALRESEERYREIFENAPDSYFLIEVTPGPRFKFIQL